MAALGLAYYIQYAKGNRDVIKLAQANEANLLYARQLARLND